MNEDIIDDIKFLLSFVPALSPDGVKPGMMSITYITGTYEGDLKLAERVQDIREKYGIDNATDIEEIITQL